MPLQLCVDGEVYQAEEVREGGKWRRHYAFVTDHAMMKVPADEVVFTEWRHALKPQPEGRAVK